MIFRETPLAGAFVLEAERFEDERGFFARTFCRREFAAHGLPEDFVQGNVSFNHKKGTLRGLHFQAPPHEEPKLVRCTSGAIFDAIVDLRQGSPTRGRSFAVELSAEERNQLYVPPGFAHGFQTLEDGTEISYLMGAFYFPEHARGYRYDDPAFGIAWPLPVAVVSEKDLALPRFEESQ